MSTLVINMNSIIQIFTIVGSTLGIFAFLQNLFKEVSKSNKEKLIALFQIVKPIDFDNLQYQIAARKIGQDIIDKIYRLDYCIQKNDEDIIGFKSIFKNRIRKQLKHFSKLCQSFNEHVQVPFWEPFSDYDYHGYAFNKEYFFEGADDAWTDEDYQTATEEYASHIHRLANIADGMEKTLIQIQKLASKDSYEYILPWKWF